MTPQQRIRFGLLLAAAGGFLFTFDLPLLRMAGSDKWTMVFVRGLMLFLSILAMWFFINRRATEKTPLIAGPAGLAVIATNALASIALVGATMETATANVVFILALVPVLTAVFSRFAIKEPIQLATWAATIFALEGVAVIVWDGIKFGSILGDGLAVVCACCTAATITIIRASKKNLAACLAFGNLLSGLIAVAIFPINLAGLAQPATFGMPSWLWLALNGLLVVPVATSLMANAPRFLPSADVSMFFLLESLLAPVWVWIVFSEKPSWAAIVGGTAVVATLLAHSMWRLYSTLQSEQAAPRRQVRDLRRRKNSA